MFKLRIFTGLILALLMLGGSGLAQENAAAEVVVRYRGIEFSYAPELFGAVLPGYDEGTPYRTDAPYFANVAPHVFFQFMRPDPVRPDINWTGELRVYHIADLIAYAEPSYREVVEQLQRLDTSSLRATANTNGADQNLTLPFMPVLNAAQVFRAHPLAVNCTSSSGIEYYTYYSQSIEPIVDGQVMYTYQGITADGAYYLSFSMPVATGLLPTSIPETIDMDAFAADYNRYIATTFEAINSTDPAWFAPASSVLWRFVDSIAVAENAPVNFLPVVPTYEPEASSAS